MEFMSTLSRNMTEVGQEEEKQKEPIDQLNKQNSKIPQDQDKPILQQFTVQESDKPRNFRRRVLPPKQEQPEQPKADNNQSQEKSSKAAKSTSVKPQDQEKEKSEYSADLEFDSDNSTDQSVRKVINEIEKSKTQKSSKSLSFIKKYPKTAVFVFVGACLTADLYYLNLGFGRKITEELSRTQLIILFVVMWFAIDNLMPESDYDSMKPSDKNDKNSKKMEKKMPGYKKVAPPQTSKAQKYPAAERRLKKEQ